MVGVYSLVPKNELDRLRNAVKAVEERRISPEMTNSEASEIADEYLRDELGNKSTGKGTK